MKIFSINQSDQRGGAATIAWNLFKGYQQYGCQSTLMVDRKFSNHPDVIEVENELHVSRWTHWVRTLQSGISKDQKHKRGRWRLNEILGWVADPAAKFRLQYGIEEFDFPGSRKLLQSGERPDIIHGHNLHGGYFDLRLLAELSESYPVFLTLHDAWMLSGHCAHSFECDRWKTGCGSCPDITIPKAIKFDNSALNWKRKRDIYMKSRLYVSTPCQWLMDKVMASMLAGACVESRVIPNGVDQTVFYSDNSLTSRDRLGLDRDAFILLFSANGIKRNRWKDFLMMKRTLARLAERVMSKPILFLALGEDAPSEQFGRVELRYVPYRNDQQLVADFYRSADIYLHAAKADTFPTSILEALSCGTPVLGTAVGGIPEQVKGYQAFSHAHRFNSYPEREATGLLCSPGDDRVFSDMLEFLMENEVIRERMGRNAAEDAKIRFSVQRQIENYLNWYQSVLLMRRTHNLQ